MRKKTKVLLGIILAAAVLCIARGYLEQTVSKTEAGIGTYLAGTIYDDPVAIIKTAEKDGWYCAMYQRSQNGVVEDVTHVAIFKCLPFGRCRYEGMSGFREPGVHRTGFWRKSGMECVVVAFGDNSDGTTQAYAFQSGNEIYGVYDVAHDLVLDIYDVPGGEGFPEFLLNDAALELLKS